MELSSVNTGNTSLEDESSTLVFKGVHVPKEAGGKQFCQLYLVKTAKPAKINKNDNSLESRDNLNE